MAARRAPMLILALVSMACGAWLGLVRIGWNLPLPWQDQLIAHGPLMVCGFLGTLISLERAVALGARWGYAAPVLVAAGAASLDLGQLGRAGPLLITAGSVVMVTIFIALWRRQASLFVATMTIGAVAWTCGNAQWLGGAPIYRVVYWWLAFLVLTIAGERLELNRVLRPTPVVRAAFVAAVAMLLAGVLIAARWPEIGVRVIGAGLLAMTWWLARFDVARRTVRQSGLTRFMGATLLGGYAWLGIGGLIAAVSGAATPGVVYDALLHSVFAGFVLSMVFAHAPLIFPAILGLPLGYRRSLYLHVGVLHASLILRVTGDLVAELGRWRGWGGLLTAAALALFVGGTVVRLPQRHRMMRCARRARYDARHSGGRGLPAMLIAEDPLANASEMTGAAPLEPLELTAYQDGAVVSRTLLKRSGGTVTLFAFDEGQALSEHTAPFDAIAHVLEGEAVITITGTPLVVHAGAMILMPANQPHAISAASRFKMLLTMIRSV